MHQTVMDAVGWADLVASIFRGGIGERLNLNLKLGALETRKAAEELTIAE